MRPALLRVAALASRRLPPEWAEAARREADAVEGNGELARWTLGLVRLALPPARVWAGLVAPAGQPAGALGTAALFALVVPALVAAAAGAALRGRGRALR